MMGTEKEEAIRLAHLILERPSADPDDDIAILARQLIRRTEEITILRALAKDLLDLSLGILRASELNDEIQTVRRAKAIFEKVRQTLVGTGR